MKQGMDLQGTDPNCSADICSGDVGQHKFKGLKGQFTFFSGRPNHFRTLDFQYSPYGFKVSVSGCFFNHILCLINIFPSLF